MTDPRYAAYQNPSHNSSGYGSHNYGRGGGGGNGGGDERRPEYAPSAPPPRAGNPGPNYRWWIPENDIRRDVIQADIQRYLGQDALVKPGEGIDENRGRRGYWIAAYRNLTTSMQEDLRADSINFAREGARGKYEDSVVHKSRQYYGSTDDQRTSATPSARSDSTLSNTPAYNQLSNSSHTGTAQTTTYPSYGNAPGTYGSNTGTYGAAPASSNSQAGYALYNNSGAGANNQGGNASYSYPAAASTQREQHGNPPSNVPRGYHENDSSSRNPANPTAYNNPSTAHASHNTAPAAAATNAAPPGYYLASDGRYYPVSQ